MLSRLAELLFWTGRYVERADDTSRIVDAYMHRLAEDPSGDATESRRALFTIMGLAPGDAPVDQGLVLDRLVYDRDDPSAITGALLAAVDNARRVREVISSEMWVCLNTTHTQLAPQRARARRVGVSSYLQFVRERAALFSGLTDATISRDETWWFLVLGQSVERIDMTARLLESRLRSARHAPDWLTLLRAAGAMESFLRATTAGTEPAAVAAFLLLDRAFPRSAYHALARADHCLGALSLADGRAGEVNQARGTIRRAQVRLEYSDPRSVLEETCATANDQITEQYFRPEVVAPWAREVGP